MEINEKKKKKEQQEVIIRKYQQYLKLEKSLSFVDKRNLSQEVENQIVIKIHRMIAEFFNVDESDILSE